MKIDYGRANFIQPLDPLLAPDRFKPLAITPLMPNFGARVEGIDLREIQPDEVKAKLREAFLRFGVLVFTHQERLSPEAQIEAASILGKPDEGSPSVDKRAHHVDVIINDEERLPIANLWHSDNSGLPNAPLGSLAQIQECPSIGGDTAWSCTRKAYDCLSSHMKEYLKDLSAVHYWDKYGHWDQGIDNYDEFEPTSFKRRLDRLEIDRPQTHPIVLPHPITGAKSLYVNEVFTTFIKGLHPHESRHILSFLFDWLRMPEFILVHHWNPNDVAVWDNFSMAHYALGDYRAHRVNQRVQFGVSSDIDYMAALRGGGR